MSMLTCGHGAQMKWFHKHSWLFSILGPLIMIDYITLHPFHPSHNHMGLSMITCHAYTNKIHTNSFSTQMHSLFRSNVVIVSYLVKFLGKNWTFLVLECFCFNIILVSHSMKFWEKMKIFIMIFFGFQHNPCVT
jgi:hypothetical protein